MATTSIAQMPMTPEQVETFARLAREMVEAEHTENNPPLAPMPGELKASWDRMARAHIAVIEFARQIGARDGQA
jgi:hypothetical protein